MTKQYDNFADLITFTRASTGTYLDSDGLLKTATTNTPRIEFDINGNRKGILIEEARTNLMTYSDFDAAVPTNWSALSDTGTFSRTLGTEIQGTPTITNVQSTDGRSFLSQSLTLSASTTYTFSCKFDPAASNISAGNSTVVAINGLDGITLPRGLFSDIDPVTGLLTFTFTTASDVTCDLRLGVGCLANATGTLVFSQPQLEEGSFPTSYIPTAGAAATRSADVASIPTSAFGYNAKIGAGGTVIADFQSDNWQYGTGFYRVWEFDGSGSNGLFHAVSNQNQFRYRLNDSGGTAVLGAATIGAVTATASAGAKIAIAYAPDDFAVYANGSQAETDNAGLFANEIVTQIAIGGGSFNTSSNGHIKSLSYFPRRLTNSQLQRLTS